MIVHYLPPDAYKKMVLDETKVFTDLAPKDGAGPLIPRGGG